MDARDADRQLIRKIFDALTAIPYSHGELRCVPIYDTEHDSYTLITQGWDRRKRIHGCIAHVDLIGGKFWIQYDGTAEGIPQELEAAGVPRDRIVLAYHEERDRKHSGYAVA